MNCWIRNLVLALVALSACDSAPPPTAASPTPGPLNPEPIVAATLPPTSASAKPIEPPPAVAVLSAEEKTKLANSANAFGLDVYGKLRDRSGNLALSPLSISSALAMTWAGARGNTAEELKKVLRFDGTQAEVAPAFGSLLSSLQDPGRAVTLRVANRLFGEKSFRFEPSYLELTKSAYLAPLEAVDFKANPDAARSQINGWVEERTEKRIKGLIPEAGIDRNTRLVLVSATYFLGGWATPFNEKATNDADFFFVKTKSKKVPTMHRVQQYRFAEADGAKMLELPYKGGYSMLVVLPNAVDGLGALEKSMSGAKLSQFVGALASKKVEVSLPKFEIKPLEPLNLLEVLKALGVVLALDPEKADFTGMAKASAAEPLYIAKAFHKAFVKVDEKGTEAAAATGVVMATKNGHAPEKSVQFKADHPFLFFVRDNESGLVLFMGRVVDPGGP